MEFLVIGRTRLQFTVQSGKRLHQVAGLVIAFDGRKPVCDERHALLGRGCLTLIESGYGSIEQCGGR